MKTYVVLNDIQLGFEDKPVLWDLVIPFVRALKPDGIILNGDITDCYSISSHRTRFEKKVKITLKHEIDKAQELMKEFSSIPEKWWLGGNHEARWDHVITDRAPELGVIEGLGFKTVFGLGEHGFRWKDYGDYVMLGKLMVTHGDIVRKYSAYTAKAHFDKFGTSVLHGHTHRVGWYCHTNIAGAHGAWENGCLCRLDGLGYTKHPDWQQAFAVIHVDAGGMFNVQQNIILNRRKFFYGGEVWSR